MDAHDFSKGFDAFFDDLKAMTEYFTEGVMPTDTGRLYPGTATEASRNESKRLAPGIHLMACDCGEPASRECAYCDKPICNSHGYLLEDEPGAPVLCGECKMEAQ